VRLAIADPPYPRHRGSRASRASFWYGDLHADAGEWDDDDRHRRLCGELLAGYDGFAIATAADCLGLYLPELPATTKVLVWHRTRAMPSPSPVIRNVWEPVLVVPARRSALHMGGSVADVLSVAPPVRGFPGAKPAAWTRWVLLALGFVEEVDEVDDLFPGSGAVAAEVAQRTLFGNEVGA
jgi:hypothetical protein